MPKNKNAYHVEFSGVPCNLCFDVDASFIGKTVQIADKTLTIEALYLNYDKQVLHLHYSAEDPLPEPTSFWTEQSIDAFKEAIRFYHPLSLQHAKMLRHSFLKPVLAIVLGMVLVAMMLLAPLIPEFLMIAGVVVGALATSYMAWPSIKAFAKNLSKSPASPRHWLSMDALYLAASLIMLGVSIASFFVPGLPMMMEAGLLLFGFKALGEVISTRMRQQLPIPVRFSDIIPKTTLRRQHETLEEVDSAALRIDDVFSQPPRKYCPVDAILIGEPVWVDESRLNGQAEPTLKQAGEIIYQGSAIVGASETLLRVINPSMSSYLARQDALLTPKNQVEQTSVLLRVYLPTILLLALLLSLVLGFMLGLIPALKIGLLILVSACPCAMSLGSALENQYAADLAHAHKADIKPGASLVALNDMDTVMLDINGTLTEGRPSVMRFEKMQDCNVSEAVLLGQANRLEQATFDQQQHPVARAIAEYSKASVLPGSEQACELEIKHNGFFDRISRYALGNADYWRARGVEVAAMRPAPGETNWVYLGKDDSIVAGFALGDALRQGAKDEIQALKAAGKMVCLATGASLETAEVYRQALALPREGIKASLASDDSALSKLSLLRSLQGQGRKVLFIGDGENDTQALAQANWSIAIKNTHQLTTAQAQADMVLANQAEQTWPALRGLFQAGEQVRRLHRQNMLLVLGLSVVSMAVCAGLVLGLGLALNPWVMALAMVLQMVAVIINTKRQDVIPFEKAPEKRPLESDSSLKKPVEIRESFSCSLSQAYGLTRL